MKRVILLVIWVLLLTCSTEASRDSTRADTTVLGSRGGVGVKVLFGRAGKSHVWLPHAFVDSLSADSVTVATLKVTGSLSTPASSNILAAALTVTANANFTGASATFSGATIANLGTVTTADINAGTFDGVVGGTVPAAITGTTITANTSLGGTLSTAAQPNVTSLGTIASLVATTADINAGTVDATIGATTPAAGTFTTLVANTSLTGTLATASQPNVTGLGTIGSLVATTADINAGTFDGVVGGTAPAIGTFTTLGAGVTALGATTATTIDGSLGSVTPAAVTGTTITANTSTTSTVLTTLGGTTNVTGNVTLTQSGGAVTVNADSFRVAFPDTTFAKASSKVLPFDMTDGQFLEIDGMTGESAYQRFLQKVKGTSWYKDEGTFPRRGIITTQTAGTDSLIIWDTTVSPIDTFMVFSATSAGNYLWAGTTITDVAFQDGVLYVTENSTTQGLAIIDFMADGNNAAVTYGSTGSFSRDDPIVDRNNATNSGHQIQSAITIVNTAVNAVSVIRDPEGATDSFGRRLPIVAVATSGGTSVSDAGINNFYDSSDATAFETVSLAPDGQITMARKSATLLMIAPKAQTISADGWAHLTRYFAGQVKATSTPFVGNSTTDALTVLLPNQSVAAQGSPVSFFGVSQGALIAHTKLGDLTNGITIDLSTTHNIARSDTLAWDLGAASQAVFNNGLTDSGTVVYADGVVGRAVTYNEASYSTINMAGTELDFGTSDFFYTFWTKSTSATNPANNDYVFCAWEASGSTDVTNLYWDSAGKPVWQVTDDGFASHDTYTGLSDVYDATWHHFAVGRDGANWKMYIDGVLTNTGAVTNAAASIDPDKLRLGGYIVNSTHFLLGSIDQFAVWKRALSQDEISFLYNRGVVATGTSSDYIDAADVDYANADPNSNTFTFGNETKSYTTTPLGLPLARIASAGGNITDAHVIASGDSSAIYQATSTKLKIYQPDLTVQQLAVDKGVEFARPIANIKRFVGSSNLHLYDAVVDSAGYGDYTTVAQALSAGALNIYVKKGTYSDPFTISQNNVTITGAGKTLTIFNNVNSTGDEPVTITSSWVTIQHCQFKTSAGGGGGAQSAVYLAQGTLTFINNRISESDHNGISISNAASSVLIANNDIRSCDNDGINMQGARCRFIGNFMDSILGDGIDLSAASTNDNVISNNTLKGCTGVSVRIAASALRNIVIGNRLDGTITDGGTGTVDSGNEATAF